MSKQYSISKAHRLLICAALDKGKLGQESFLEWANLVQLTNIDYASQKVLPAIVHQLNNDELSRQILKLVKFTRLRSQTLLEAGLRAEDSLKGESIPVAWVAGGAVIATTKINISNRALDDVGLLVPSSEAETVARLLRESGFQLLPNTGLVDSSLVGDYKNNVFTVRDAAGANVSIYWHSVASRSSALSEQALWSRVSKSTLAERETFSISPEDLLLQVFATNGRGNQALWVIDATRILEVNEINFKLLLSISRERRLWLKAQISLTRLALFRPDLTPAVNRYFAPILKLLELLIPKFFWRVLDKSTRLIVEKNMALGLCPLSELSNKHRVLYFCSRLPGVIQGGLDLRVQGQILSLLSSCEVSVFGLNGNGNKLDERIHSWQSSKDLTVSQQIDAEAGIKALSLGGHPFAARYSDQTAAELKQEILNFKPTHIILSRIDLSVYLDAIRESFKGQLILDLDESVESTGPSILNVMTHPGQGLVFKTFCARVIQVEEESFKKVDQVWVSSKVEMERVRSKFDSITPKISTVPNSVLVEAYAPNPELSRDKNTLIYPASFGYVPNVHAAKFLIDELMPLIPEIKLKLVGSHMPKWMRDAAIGNISIEGPVVNMVPYLQTSSALVVPLKAGGGTRLKVIEALASGLPIVSTAMGVEGLGLTSGEDYLEAETPQEFAEQCRELLLDRTLAESLSQRGRITAKQNFSINVLEKLILDLITNGTS